MDNPLFENPTLVTQCISDIADFAWRRVRSLSPEERVEMRQTLDALTTGNCPFQVYRIREGLKEIVDSAIRSDRALAG